MSTIATRSLKFGEYRLDLAAQQLWRGREAISLRPRSWDVLVYLARRPGVLVTNAELLDAMWRDTAVTPNALTNIISDLRTILADREKPPRVIETVHRRGYRFIAEIEAATEDGGREGISDSPAAPVKLIGRDAELRELSNLWRMALQGKRQVVFVSGEPGIGKTTLVTHFVDSLSVSENPPAGPRGTPPWRVVKGQCIEQHGTSEAYMPVLEIVETLASGPRAAASAELLQRYAPTWLSQVPSLLPAAEMRALRASLVGVGSERMLREGAALLEAFAADQALLLVIEDLHWSDPATLDLISFLAQRPNPSRLMVVVTYRPVDAVVRNHPVATMARRLNLHRRATQIVPAPFTGAEVCAYLDQQIATGAIGERLAPLIEFKSGGNPLFVNALLAHLVQQGWLQEREGEWRLVAAIDTHEIGLPEELRVAIESQLSALPPETISILEAASVEGEEFSARAAAAGTGMGREAVEDALHEAARRHQLVSLVGDRTWPDGEKGPRYRFKHALYRQAVMDTIVPSRRRQLHQRIGECLESAYGERAGEIDRQLLAHFEASDDIERRVRYREHAAAVDFLRFAHADAATDLGEALAQIRRLPATPERSHRVAHLELSLGNALLFSRGSVDPEAHEAFARAEAAARDARSPRERFRALTGLRSIFLARGDLSGLEKVVREVLAIARSEVPSLAGQANWLAGELDLANGNLAAARDHWETSLRVDGEPGIPVVIDFRSAAASLLGTVLGLMGFLEEARRAREDALRRSVGAGMTFSHCYVLWQLTLCCLLHRDHEGVRHFAEACCDESERCGFVAFRAIRPLARVALGKGLTGREVRAIIAENGPVSGDANARILLCQLVEAHLAYGEVGAAHEALEQEFDGGGAEAERLCAAELWRLRGEIATRRRTRAPAKRQAGAARPGDSSIDPETCFRKAIDIARGQQAKLWELRAAVSLARFLAQQGRARDGRELLSGVHEWFPPDSDSADLRDARALLAGAKRAR